MKSYLKKLSLFLLIIALCFIVGCDNKKDEELDNSPIIVLFTNDVHCGIEDGIGYAGVASLKKQALEENKYVTLVDCGDHIQGSTFGTVSKGEAIIDIMNAVGYDFATIGNHEFDYGMDQLQTLIEQANFKYIASNISYSGKNEKTFIDDCTTYQVVSYGSRKVGYVAVTTPTSPYSSRPTYFKEDGEYVYHFGAMEEEKNYITLTQEAVNQCKKEGADYIVLLSHLGINKENGHYDVYELIENTTGIDIVLDAHSHSVVNEFAQNKDKEEIILVQTGTKLENVGKLTIDSEGGMQVQLINEVENKDEEITKLINDQKEKLNKQLNEVVASSNVALLTTDSEGIRMVRNREMPIGDLVSDAYRIIGDADIGFINGGGIRNDLPNGNITYSDIISVNPFGNTLCVVEVTGAELLDMLEYFYKDVQSDYKSDGKPIGENGSFGQLSGLKIEIDTSITSSVVTNENDMLLSVGETRRITKCEILENGSYITIDKNKTYTFATHNYCAKNGGCGMELYLKNHKIVADEIMLDYQVLITYIKDNLKGDLSDYQTSQNRIVIK